MSAPSEFASMGLDAAKFRKVGPSEYHGPCPMCGGVDRFRVHTDKPFPHWYCVCREGTGCNWRGWADQLAPHLRQPLTDEQRREYAAQRQAQDRAEAERRQKQLERFSAEELWLAYSRKMGEAQRAWWRAQGIADSEQDYWRLGWTPQAPISGNPEAYTIPYFGAGWKSVNMQYRLANAESADKYRWAGLGYSSYFIAHPDLALTDEVVICEGAKKAMVYASHEINAVQVFAVPSKSDWAGLPEAVREVGRVWVVLDPDGIQKAQELARAIGKSARVVVLPSKFDDLLNMGMTLKAFDVAKRYARN